MKLKSIVAAVAAAMLSAGAYAGGGEHSKQQPRAESGNGAMTQSQSGRQQAGSQGAQQQAQSPEVVKRAQQALKEKGIDAGPVDGQWGPLTQKGVKQYQEQNQIQASGQLDRQTLAALGVEQSASAGSSSPQPGASSGGANGSAGAGSSSGSAAPEQQKSPGGAAGGSSPSSQKD